MRKKPSNETKPQTRLPIFDTMMQCSSATGIPVSVMKQAKRGGSDAFKHGRIDLQKLLHWIFAKGPATVDWGDEFKKWRSKLEELKHDKEIKKLVVRADEIARAYKFASWQRDYLTEKLTKEYPSAVAGLDVAGAMAYGRRVVVAICESTQQMVKEIERQ
jgi:hypothetical protein